MSDESLKKRCQVKVKEVTKEVKRLIIITVILCIAEI